jgi:hypothetical protein
MKRKRWLLAVVVLIAAVVAGSVIAVLLTGPKHRISVETFKTLRVGMTLDEITRAFGRPPGLSVDVDLDVLAFVDDRETPVFGENKNAVEMRQWGTDNLIVQVHFDHQGRAVFGVAVELVIVRATFFERIRRLLRLA